jgi:Zn-dependent metalloprotease
MKILKKIMILLVLLQWHALQAQQWEHVDPLFEVIDAEGQYLRVINPVAGNTDAVLQAIASMNGSAELNTYTMVRENRDPGGNIHKKYQRKFNGINVERSMVILHCNSEGIVQTVNGDFDIAFDSKATVSRTPEEAVLLVVSSLPEEVEYKWENMEYEDALKAETGDPDATYYPTATLLYVKDHDGNTKPAYLVSVMAIDENYSSYSYVNASTGEMMESRSPLKYCFGGHQANTQHHNHGVKSRYVRSLVAAETKTVFAPFSIKGTKAVDNWCNGQCMSLSGVTDDYGTRTVNGSEAQYSGSVVCKKRLKVICNNLLIQTVENAYTCNCNNCYCTSNISGMYDYTESSSNFTAAPQKIGVQTHFCLERTVAYYSGTFSRNSMDGTGSSVIGKNVVTSTNNTFFDPQTVFIQISPAASNLGSKHMNSLDIVGHEFSHGVVMYEFGGMNAGEPSAVEESFCDIMGAMTAHHAKSNTPGIPSSFSYVLGSDVLNNASDPFYCGGTFYPQYRRDMSNPNSSVHPDTYNGTNWIPFSCGGTVPEHVNGQVGNFWFYLLAEGGSGTNDLSNAYCVTGIGKAKATQIAYYAMCNQFSSSTNYASARTGTIQAAINLGYSQDDIAQVTQAWYAVGVGSAYAGPINITGTYTNTQTVAYNCAIQVQNYTNQATGANVTIKSNTQIAFLPNINIQSGSILNAFIGPTCGGGGARIGSDDDGSRKDVSDAKPAEVMPQDLTAEANANTSEPAKNTPKSKRKLSAVSDDIAIVPNPSNGNFVLKLKHDEELPVSIVITDIMGKVVKETGVPNSYDVNFDLGDASKGVYLIKVNYKGETVIKRMVKNQ